MRKGLVARKRFRVGGTSEEFQKECDNNLRETEMVCREEYSNKLFSLIDSFWVEIGGKRIDICCTGKDRVHLDKVEKEEQRIKQKKLTTLAGNSSIKKMIFERFNEHLSHLQFKAYFLS